MNAYSTARLALGGAAAVPVTKDYITNLPYASIGARIGRGQRAMLVLGRYDGADRHWISADRAVLVTRNGRLVRTFGVGVDLRETLGLEGDPVAAATLAFDGTHRRAVDAGLPLQYGIIVESTFEVMGRRTIEILDTSFDTLWVRERNEAQAVRWRFDNEFWFDFQSGYVWKSRQHFAPDVPPVEIEVYKRDA
jgi:hypothetical protein